jgi:predicted negative regulator of RcsB-dependent stress response
MEIIIGLIVIAGVVYYIFRNNAKANEAVAPYKVEAKAVVAKVETEVKADVAKVKATVKKATTRKPKAK